MQTIPPTNQFPINNFGNLKWIFQTQQPLQRSALQLLPLKCRHLTIDLDNDINLDSVSHSKLQIEKNKQLTMFSGPTHLNMKYNLTNDIPLIVHPQLRQILLQPYLYIKETTPKENNLISHICIIESRKQKYLQLGLEGPCEQDFRIHLNALMRGIWHTCRKDRNHKGVKSSLKRFSVLT